MQPPAAAMLLAQWRPLSQGLYAATNAETNCKTAQRARETKRDKRDKGEEKSLPHCRPLGPNTHARLCSRRQHGVFWTYLMWCTAQGDTVMLAEPWATAQEAQPLSGAPSRKRHLPHCHSSHRFYTHSHMPRCQHAVKQADEACVQRLPLHSNQPTTPPRAPAPLELLISTSNLLRQWQYCHLHIRIL